MASMDVATVLEQLRSAIRERRQAITGASDPARNAVERELQRSLEQIEITRVVSAHWPLEGRNLPERAWALFNRLVRLYLRWYINPIVEQQNSFNDVAARMLRLLVESHNEVRTQIAALQSNADDGDSADSSGPHTDIRAIDDLLSVDDVQALVERLGKSESPAALADIEVRPLLAPLVERRLVNAHWKLEGRTLIQKGWALLNKLVRRYLRWLINPIVEQQNAYNAALIAAVTALLAADAEARATLASLRAQRSNEASDHV